MLFSNGDLPYLVSIAKAFGSEHFGLSAMFKAAHPTKHGYWSVFLSDDLRGVMNRLVRKGFAIESEGPRGGAGWSLTKTGIAHGLATEKTGKSL